MKKVTLLLLLLLLALPTSHAPETTGESPVTFSEIRTEYRMHRLISDRSRRQKRQNEVHRVNKRNKRNLKKWNLAEGELVKREEVSRG